MIWLYYLNWQCTVLEIVYLNQRGTSYWHCSRCSSFSYKASPGVPHYSKVCLVLTTLRMEKRRSALANKDLPYSKQIQKGNIKGHLGDKENCCTWQYIYRNIHLRMYTYKYIHSHTNLLYILSNTCYHSSSQVSDQSHSMHSPCTPLLCISKVLFPSLPWVVAAVVFPKHTNLASLILEKLLAKRQQVYAALCSQLLSDEVHVCFRSGIFLENSDIFYLRDFLPGHS